LISIRAALEIREIPWLASNRMVSFFAVIKRINRTPQPNPPFDSSFPLTQI
jgi:hypothetical protein